MSAIAPPSIVDRRSGDFLSIASQFRPVTSIVLEELKP